MLAMPELPEVETVVRQLRPRLIGRRIEGVRVLWDRTVAKPSVDGFRRGLRGRTFTGLRRRAKYLVFELDGGDHEPGGRLLVGHLRMTGRFFLGDDEAARGLRADFELDRDGPLHFADLRKFGRLALVRRLDEILPALGPEPLGPDFDGEWLARELRARRRQLKPLLLDQSFIAGIGNIYADESLHRAGLHPLRSSQRVPAKRAQALADAIRDILQRAIDSQGSSFDVFYRTPEGQPGNFQDQFQVYGRTDKPCHRCGRAIKRILVGQRATHFCTRCQPAPRPRRLKTSARLGPKARGAGA